MRLALTIYEAQNHSGLTSFLVCALFGTPFLHFFSFSCLVICMTPIPFWFQNFEIIVMSCYLDGEFKSELQESLLVLLSKGRICAAARVE